MISIEALALEVLVSDFNTCEEKQTGLEGALSVECAHAAKSVKVLCSDIGIRLRLAEYHTTCVVATDRRENGTCDDSRYGRVSQLTQL